MRVCTNIRDCCICQHRAATTLQTLKAFLRDCNRKHQGPLGGETSSHHTEKAACSPGTNKPALLSPITRTGVQFAQQSSSGAKQFSQVLLDAEPLSNYFSKFIQGYAAITACMQALWKKNAAWKWTEACADAFRKVKHMLTTAPVMALPDPTLPFDVVPDAC